MNTFEEKRGMRYALWLALALCFGATLQQVLNAVPWDGREWCGKPLSSWQTPVFTGVFCAGAWVVSVGIGAIFWSLLLPIVGASWGQSLRPIWKRLTAISFGGGWLLLFMCFPALPLLYVWAGNGGNMTAFWQNTQMWAMRMGIVCAISVGLSIASFRVNDIGFGKTSRVLGAVGLLVFVPTVTVLGTDLWIMSQPTGTRFSMMPLVFMAEAGVSALCAAAWSPVARIACLRRSLMGLLLAVLSFKVYFSFSQYLIVQYGNIPSETAFYSLREQAMGECLFYSLAVCNLILPLLIAVVPFFRRNIWGSRVVAAVCLLITLSEFYVCIAPAVPGKGFTIASVLFYGASVIIAGVLGTLVALGRNQDPDKL